MYNHRKKVVEEIQPRENIVWKKTALLNGKLSKIYRISMRARDQIIKREYQQKIQIEHNSKHRDAGVHISCRMS